MSKRSKRKQPPDNACIVNEPPRPRAFTPRPCTSCSALRPKGTSYSRVYSKHGNMRYCRCDFCNNTWSEYFEVVAMPIATTFAKNVDDSVPLEYGIVGNSAISD